VTHMDVVLIIEERHRLGVVDPLAGLEPCQSPVPRVFRHQRRGRAPPWLRRAYSKYLILLGGEHQS
jgi:hypothetical protein